MAGFAAIVKLTTQPGARDAAAAVFSSYMDTVEGEDGVLQYVLAADAEHADVLWLYESYADGASLDAHLATDAYQAMYLAAAEHMAEPPVLTVVEQLRAKGVAAV